MIPVAYPYIGKKAVEYVRDALTGHHMSPAGPWGKRFADELGRLFRAKVVLTNSGTSALEVALIALGHCYAKKGAVIVPAYTCPDVAMAVQKAGFEIVVADVDPHRLCITAGTVRAAALLAKNVVGVIIVHVYGMGADPSLYLAARELGLFIIDDVAEAFGVEPAGRDLLSMSDVACHSFRGDKILPIGTGGAVVTRHDGVTGVAQAVVGLNSADGFSRYWPVSSFVSYEFPEALAAVGVAQLEEWPRVRDMRRVKAMEYRANGLDWCWQPGDVPWKMPVRVMDSWEAWEALDRKYIQASPGFVSIDQVPAFRGRVAGEPRVARMLGSHMLGLPLFPDLRTEQIREIAQAVKRHLDVRREPDASA